MYCPKCDNTIEDNSTECPFCGIIIAKYRRAEAPHPGAGAALPEKEAAPAKIPYLWIGIAAAVVILVFVMFKPKYASDMTVISFPGKEPVTLSCDAQEKCVVVYLAPW
jgi:uncharacterized membrane protein YvbJ